MIKRALDVTIAAASLAALSPLLAILAWRVRRDVGPPALFRQTRPGLHGAPFRLVKFRTMRDGPGTDEERLTDFGLWLRSTSLDELPELWNVLRGDMSLVGPRPLLMEYLPLYSPRQASRHDVRPGLTGWAQVNGRNAVEWEERLEMDAWYVENRSLALDLRILWMTLRRVISREGISAKGEATMPRFKGSK